MKYLDLKSRSIVTALGLTVQDAPALLRDGAAAWERGDVETAHASALLCSALDARSIAARYLRAAAAMRLHDESDALRAYMEIIALDPKELRAWVDRATIEISQLRFADAAQSLKSAIALDPKASKPAGLRAQMLVIETLEKAQEGSEA